MDEHVTDVDVDALIAEMHQRVARRRADGDYPFGLEHQLEAEFEQVMLAMHRTETDTGRLEERIDRIDGAVSRIAGAADTQSRLPGGSAVHAATARLVGRHTHQLADSVRSLGSDIERALREVQRLFEAQRAADERQLREVLDALLDRIAVLDHVAELTVELERRIGALEAASTNARPA